MYAIEWAEDRTATWTGQGYCAAPWLAKKYDTAAEAQLRAGRVNGVVVPWRERRKDQKPEAVPDDGCPF